MVDVTTLAVLGGSATLVAKILGPTAAYIGDGLRTWTEARVRNVKAIFSNAETKLGDAVDSHGAVPPRVLKSVLQEGSYIDDDVGIEYFGGILASSRTEAGGDDRGVAWANLLGSLSSYTLRAHFVIYSALAREFDGEEINHSGALLEYEIFIARDDFVDAIGLSTEEDEEVINSITAHVFFSLHTYELLGRSGWNTRVEEEGTDLMGTLVRPSAQGAELFLWALGLGHTTAFSDLFNAADSIPERDDLPKPQLVRRTAPEEPA